MSDPILPLPGSRPVAQKAAADQPLRKLTQEMEVEFLSEMLGHAGLDASSDSFGGGIGEDQFQSFLRREQATAMVRAGGIGLAESLFKAMTKGQTDAGR